MMIHKATQLHIYKIKDKVGVIHTTSARNNDMEPEIRNAPVHLLNDAPEYLAEEFSCESCDNWHSGLQKVVHSSPRQGIRLP